MGKFCRSIEKWNKPVRAELQSSHDVALWLEERFYDSRKCPTDTFPDSRSIAFVLFLSGFFFAPHNLPVKNVVFLLFAGVGDTPNPRIRRRPSPASVSPLPRSQRRPVTGPYSSETLWTFIEGWSDKDCSAA